jgi:hypothetical protein
MSRFRPGFVAPTFRPRRLFLSGEDGIWLDPSDPSTLFQDAAGTVPAGVDDPVGLILDKSAGLAETLVHDEDFSTDTSGDWTSRYGSAGSIDWDSGNEELDLVNGTGWDFRYRTVATVAGAWYRIAAEIAAISGAAGSNYLFGPDWTGGFGGAGGLLQLTGFGAGGTAVAYFRATGTTGKVGIHQKNNGGTVSLARLQVHRVAGVHVWQQFTAKRATLRADANGNRYLEGDGASTILTTSSFSVGGADILVAAAVKFDNVASLNVLIGENDATNVDWRFAAPGDGNLEVQYSGAALSVGTGQTDICALSATHYGTDWDGYRNGVSLGGPLSVAKADSVAAMTLFARGDEDLHSNGRIHGLVVVKAQKTDADRRALERWMAGKAGVAP